MSPHGAPVARTYGRLFTDDDLTPGDPGQSYRTKLAGVMVGSDNQGENADISAGYTYFGQFLDHDLTFDAMSALDKDNDPAETVNLRTPRFDLDSIYGGGRDDQPFLYQWEGVDERRTGTKFLLVHLQGHDADDNGRPAYDVPRNIEDRALIADPRNDENQIVLQMHVLFLRFHNEVVDHIVEQQEAAQVADDKRLAGKALFTEARRLVTLHYHHIILHDYLPTVLGPVTYEILKKHRPLKDRMPEDGSIPVEFSVAAFRFGHTMIRKRYRLRKLEGVDFPIFDADENVEDLQGLRPLLYTKRIFWTTFFQPRGARVQHSAFLDHRLSPALHDVPDRGSLPELNLLRSDSFDLPHGGGVAAKVQKALEGATLPKDYEVRPLTNDELWGTPKEPDAPWEIPDFSGEEKQNARKAVEGHTPLWFYLLREADVLGGGSHLGPVGGLIVGEVFLSVLDRDLDSLLHHPSWKPSLWPGDTTGTGTMGQWSLLLHQAYVHYERDWEDFQAHNHNWHDHNWHP
jgi:hypothetical protein